MSLAGERKVVSQVRSPCRVPRSTAPWLVDTQAARQSRISRVPALQAVVSHGILYQVECQETCKYAILNSVMS